MYKKTLLLLISISLLLLPMIALSAPLPFIDVANTASYYDHILFVYENGIMNGTSTNRFSPDGDATRAMIATVIWRLENSPLPEREQSFTDTPTNTWYSQAVAWTAENHIYTGFEDDTFRPESSITKEQLLAVLYRYAQYKNLTSNTDTDILPKNIKVSVWGKEAVFWALSQNIMAIGQATQTDFTQSATRAEIAQCLHNLMENISTSSKKEAFIAKTIQTEKETFHYLLYTPQNATENMPLIIYLHGGSGKGSDLSLLTANSGFPQYLQEGKLGNIPAYIAIPQLSAKNKGWANAKEFFPLLIETLKQDYHINSENIALTGHSMGGTGTWEIALTYPEMFARIAPLSGSIKDTETNLDKLAKLPIKAFVGDQDTIVPPQSSIDFIRKLEGNNQQATVTVIQNATHFDIPQLVYLNQEISLVNWLIGEGEFHEN